MAARGSATGLTSISAPHGFGDARHQRIAGRIAVVAADEQQGLGVDLRVVGAGDSVLGGVERTGGPIDPDLVRLEDRANLVILFLEDRVIHVIMAAGAADGDSQEGLPGVVDHVLHPLLAAEQLEVPREISGGAEGIQILGAVLVGGEHLDDHAIVRLVLVERFDDPVAPVPDMGLTVADLLAPAGPVAVPPDVHPVPPPTLAVSRAGQQAIHDLLISVGVLVIEERIQLVGSGWESGQVEIEPSQYDRPRRLGPRRQPARLVFGGDERIDRVADPASRFHEGDRAIRRQGVTTWG